VSNVTVQRVTTEWGSRIEPPLDQSWSDLEKLRWHAAVVGVDAGVVAPRVDVCDYSSRRFGIWFPNRGYYTVQGCGPLRYAEAWDYLNGMLAGAKLVRLVGMV